MYSTGDIDPYNWDGQSTRGFDCAGNPEEVEGGLGLSREDRRLVQMGLSSAGYDPGPVDGLIGGRTREAIRRWQGSRGEAETGYLDADGATELLRLGARAADGDDHGETPERLEREEAERAEARRLLELDAERRREAARQEEAEREAREAEARRERERQPGTKFRDCPECPELVVVPPGSFMMGSPASEEGRWGDEGPVHRVMIAEPFAVGVHEVTRGEFARFVSATGRSMGDCSTYWGVESSGRHWRSPGFRQGDDHPVVCVDWDDVRAYVSWLSRETGQRYRLLSESEWEYVARAGTSTARYWGESESGQCRYANGADLTAGRRHDGWTVAECDDGHYATAPVGSFSANEFGLHDVHGNVWEWVEDCWNASYAGAPGDGSAWESGDCSGRVLRGGSWASDPWNLRSAYRREVEVEVGGGSVDGFRVARTLAR